MEGMHTYQIDKLGAESVTSIETNSNTYLRCLVMKEILQYIGKRELGRCDLSNPGIYCDRQSVTPILRSGTFIPVSIGDRLQGILACMINPLACGEL
jgi:hypothetical protein